MSRCFPYPPPGYKIKAITNDDLIESLKREAEKAKKEKKKERKRKNKGREKSKENEESGDKKHGRKIKHKDDNGQDERRGQKEKRQRETESLEKSSITEEHGHPVGSEDSSNSTLNSDKRQKMSISPDDSQTFGSVFRIRLPFQRHKDPEVLPSKEHPCPSWDGLVQCKHKSAPCLVRGLDETPCSTSEHVSQGPTLMQSIEEPCPTSGASEFLSMPSSSCMRISKASPKFSQFRELFQNWVPPPMLPEFTDSNDQGWLFETRQNHSNGVESCSVQPDGFMGQGNSYCWPRAHYLADADIYALPFTVPI